MTGNSTRKPVAHAASRLGITVRLARSGWALLLLTGSILLGGGIASVNAAEQPATNSLKSVEFAGLPGNKAQVILTLSNTAASPLSFTIDNPARIALDFPETSNGLSERSHNIGIGMAQSMTVVEAKGRTRVVVNLAQMVPYEAHAEGNTVVLTIQSAGRELSAAQAAAMGSGTGVRAVRHRKTAREAMVGAYKAVPCWVLPQWPVPWT